MPLGSVCLFDGNNDGDRVRPNQAIAYHNQRKQRDETAFESKTSVNRFVIDLVK